MLDTNFTGLQGLFQWVNTIAGLRITSVASPAPEGREQGQWEKVWADLKFVILDMLFKTSPYLAFAARIYSILWDPAFTVQKQ